MLDNAATAPDISCDLVVVGSGAAGLAAAVTAAFLGLDVVVVEKDAQIGGTTAWSGGWMWIPRNPLAVEAGIVEDIEQPLAYLRAELGDGFNDAICRRFLTEGPRMVSFMRANTALDFVDGNAIPDFHHQSESAGRGGRSICAAPFDGKVLGARLTDVKRPLDLVAPFGMGIAAGADLRHFLNATRKLKSFSHVAKRLIRHFCEKFLYGRGMHLVAGNALVARLVKSADTLNIRFFTATPALGVLTSEDGSVVGIRLGGKHSGTRLNAKRGVVLAAGGFPHDPVRKSRMFPHAPTGHEHFSAAPHSNTGDGLRLGEMAGGFVRDDLLHAGAWAPVSLVPRRDGTFGHFPHLIERAKPGLIMVRRTGQRFANEANSYHDVMQALFAATPPGEPAESWIIADHSFVRRFGLGRVRPRPFPVRPWLNNGYLKRGRTVAELAKACGIDAPALEATFARVNRDAELGCDSEFGRGDGAYNRIQGDADTKPNPCVAPIGPGPYYAVHIVPGSLGTFSGLATDIDARVVTGDGRLIPGLYAVGNDMASMMAGRYPAGGITLGPGMTFGYIAAHHAAGVPLGNNRTADTA